MKYAFIKGTSQEVCPKDYNELLVFGFTVTDQGIVIDMAQTKEGDYLSLAALTALINSLTISDGIKPELKVILTDIKEKMGLPIKERKESSK